MGPADARWWPGPGLDAGTLGERVEWAEAALAAAPPWKTGRRKRLHALALADTEPDHLLKIHDYTSASWWRRLRRSKARRELLRAAAVAARRVPTPLPVGAGEVRRRGLLVACYLLVPLVPGAVDLRRAWQQGLGGARAQHAWTRALGKLARRMHDGGISQRDLAPNNFLWRPGNDVPLVAIDFERARVGGLVSRRARRHALAKLERHFAGAGAAARMRFLLAYAGGDRAAARAWWHAIEGELARLTRRDVAHLRRTAAGEGRRVTRVEHAGWCGLAVRGTEIGPVCAGLDSTRDGGKGGATTHAHGSYWIRSLGPRRGRARRRTWALVQALALRSMAPPPTALLARDGAAWLVFARRAQSDRLLAELAREEAPGARAAVGILFDRLLAAGYAVERLGPEGIAVVRGTVLRARVLAPEALVRRSTPRGAERHRRARAAAAALLARAAFPGSPSGPSPRA